MIVIQGNAYSRKHFFKTSFTCELRYRFICYDEQLLTSGPGKQFKPITYEHREGTTQHMVVELRTRENELRVLAKYIVQLERWLDTRATLSTQMATAQSAAVVATVPAAA